MSDSAGMSVSWTRWHVEAAAWRCVRMSLSVLLLALSGKTCMLQLTAVVRCLAFN